MMKPASDNVIKHRSGFYEIQLDASSAAVRNHRGHKKDVPRAMDRRLCHEETAMQKTACLEEAAAELEQLCGEIRLR